MKAGIAYSDRVTTVSPGYAEEITEAPQDYGMAPLLAQHPEGVAGILNGIDTRAYNPASDGVLTYPYDVRHPENKEKNKGELRQRLGLQDRDVPLIAMVTRLDDAKGMDLLIKVLPKLDTGRLQIVVLGSGSPYYQGLMSNLARERQGMMTVCFAYHPDLARRIYAAADMYLMPSRTEPCGIGQMIAQRYGAVPVVSPVGGLKDTVLDFDARGSKATGFYIPSMTSDGLLNAINKALAVYGSKEWKRLMKNGMEADFSWAVPAAAYQALYETLYLNTK
jgi:starch synthase